MKIKCLMKKKCYEKKNIFMKKEILSEKMERAGLAGSARATAAAAEEEEEEEDPLSTHSLQISFEEKSKKVRKKIIILGVIP